MLARPDGPACHLGTATCFDNHETVTPLLSFVAELERVIAGRYETRPEGSYTTRLFDAGTRRIAQKVGEEGVETALAAVSGDDEEIRNEAADLLYHLLVLLHASGVPLADVVRTLRARHS